MSSKRDGGAWLLPLLSWHFWTAKCQAPPSRKGVHSLAFIAFFVIFHKISCVVHGLPDSGTIETMPDTNIEPELTSLRTKLTVEIDKDKKEIECLKKRMNKNEVLLEAGERRFGGDSPCHRPDTGYGSKRQTIREAINRITKLRFIQDEVEAEIKKINPAMEVDRNRIRAALWAMTERNKA